MAMLLIPVFALFFLRANCQDVDQYGVSVQDRFESLERLLLNPNSFNAFVEPCPAIFDSISTSITGEQSSAEWTRVSHIKPCIPKHYI